MPASVIAAQLYTLREFLKTPEDIASSLKKVRQLGYESVQVSGLGPIEPVRLKEAADQAGVMKGSQQLYAEVGEGNLEWPAILDACREAGVEWYIVEQDTCQRDPFESLGLSLMNLRRLGLQ